MIHALGSRFRGVLSSSTKPRVTNAKEPLHGATAIVQQCDVCCGLQVTLEISSSGTGRRDQSILRCKRDFDESACRGCRRCNAVTKALESLDLNSQHYQRIIVVLFGTGACYLKIPAVGITLQFYTPIGYPPAWSRITHGHEISCSAEVGQTTNFIRSCLNACDSGHALCKQPTLRMPTRVIDVGRTNDTHVRLVETARIRASPYVALSYCWGRNSNLLTTQANLRAMVTGIQVSGFPQTVRDAVKVTRELSLRYLWVDAVCIIQDSQSDWEVESARMASVYNNAYLTIAAGTSASASEGFLHQRHLTATQQQPFRMDWHTDRGQRSVLAVRLVPGIETHTYSIDGDRQQILPLNVRGWTLQEELLSRRTVTYTQNELWWTCQAQKNCECHTFDNVTADGPKSFFSPTSMLSPTVAFSQWRATVSEFSQRRLSYGLDKLPALSGLASVIREKTGTPYIAGLWKDSLVMDLNWCSPGMTLEKLDTANTKATEGYTAPTFSWASADGLIDFFQGSFVGQDPATPNSARWHPKSSLIDANSVVDGNNPLGRVKAGHAILRGHVFRAALEIATTHMDRSKSYIIRHNGESMNFHPDVRLEAFKCTKAGSKGVPVVSVCRSPARSKAQPAWSGLPVLLFYLGDWTSPDGKVAVMTYLALGTSPKDVSKYERLGLAHRQFRLGLDRATSVCGGSVETITLL